MQLFNPHKPDFSEFDAETRRIFEATIGFFEGKGKEWLLQQDRDHVWFDEFLEFQKKEKVFATLLTPSALADGDPNKRWDEARVTKYSQILGFYGMSYWYVWQVVLKAYETFGPGKLTEAEVNQFWAECAIAAVIPEAAQQILDGSPDALPSTQVRAGLRPLLGKVVNLQQIDGALDLSWHTDQLHRLGAGREPDPTRSWARTALTMGVRNGPTAFRAKRG